MRLLTFLLLFLSASCFGQTNDVFRMVGTGTWSTINDSTYQATVTFQSDLTGKGYLANQITTSFRLFSPIGAVYRIDAATNLTFSSATLTIVELIEATAAPTGQVMVYNPNGRATVAQNPFGSTGATAQLQAAIDTWNATVSGSGGSVVGGDAITVSGDTVNIGGPMGQNRTINATGDTLAFDAGLFHVDNGGIARLENWQLERGNNSTGLAVINVTVNADVNIPLLPEGTVKAVFNNSGSALDIDPIGATTVDGQGGYTLYDGESVFIVYNSTEDDWMLLGKTSPNAGGTQVDSLVSTSVTAWIGRSGGSTSTLATSASGVYNITLNNRAELDYISLKGTNANLNGSNELVLNLINTTNSRSRRLLVQVYDANNGALVDQQVTGTNHTQTVSGATTTLTIPGLNGFGATGYYIEIR